MSLAISAVTSNNATFDTGSAPKQAPKLTESEQIKQLASEGHTAQTIATTIGLPEPLVASDLGTTTTTSSTKSQASALLALSARLSVHA